MKSLLSSLLALLLIVAFSPASLSAQAMEESDKTIVQLASETDDLSTLVAAVKAAGLTDALSADGPLTVFAPTNSAFEQLPAGVLEALLLPENKQSLTDILKYHVSSGKLTAEQVIAGIEDADDEGLTATTLNGDFSAMLDGDAVRIKDAQGNQASVTTTDIMASNGVVHLIDRVLLPDNVDVSALTGTDAMGMAADEMESDVESEWDETKEDAKMAGNEMKSEANEAKEEMKSEWDETKKDAKMAGNEMKSEANEAKEEMKSEWDETKKDAKMAGNEMKSEVGIEEKSTAAVSNRQMGNMSSNPNNTLVDVAMANEDFSTLVSAIEAAELGDVLGSDAEFTVFAPSNAAFDKLPEGKLDELTAKSNQEELQGLLTYHVVASRITAADLTKAIEKNNGYFRIQTMSGETLIASMKDDQVVLTDGNGEYATVTDTDIDSSNGLIHVIDGVLTPRM